MKSASKRFVCLALVSLALAVTAADCRAREWHVAPDAPASADGTLDSPSSLFGAIDRALPNDTVIARGGTYALARKLFLEKEGLTLRSYPGETPVLTMPTDKRDLSAVVWLSARGTGIDGIEIIGGAVYCVKIDFPDCFVKNSRIHGSGRDCIKITPSADNCLIENCEIFDSGRTGPSNAEGIDNVAADNCIIRNCYVHDITTNGIYIKGGAANCIIENNVVTDCGDNGIMLGQSTDLVYIRRPPHECVDSVARGNFVARINGAGLAFEAALRCRFEDNTVYDAGRVNHGGVSVQANEHGTASKDVTFTGNTIIVLAGTPMVAVHPGGLLEMTDMTCDENVYMRPSGPATFAWEPSGLTVTGLAAWRAATPFDRHSSVVGAPAVATPVEPD